MMACILVIDANPRIRIGLRHILEYAGYDVVEACDGGEGVSGTHFRHIDLVILDRRRPASGEAMRLLQTLRPAVKMIVMADEKRPDALPEGLGARGLSAHCTLQKPVGARDLLAAVQALLEGP